MVTKRECNDKRTSLAVAAFFAFGASKVTGVLRTFPRFKALQIPVRT
jgi:hypothetical protein